MRQAWDLQVVYGGQWGSEGKGQIVAFLAEEKAREGQEYYAVRVGGPNAGHSFRAANGELMKTQSIPVPAFIDGAAIPVIGAGGVILPDIFDAECKWIEAKLKRSAAISVDRHAAIIMPEHMAAETEMKERIGSTGEGVGAVTAAKVMRTATSIGEYFATRKEFPNVVIGDPSWEKYVTVCDTVSMVSSMGLDVLIEGTQGYLLSLNVGGFYPFCTSRDCGPEALMSQVGVSPRGFKRTETIAVMRTYPIRVGGNSGPMPGEITWETLKNESGGYVGTPEITTVTKKQRRIARWNKELAHRTMLETRPSAIALTFLDYVFPEVANSTGVDQLPKHVLDWLYDKQMELETPIKYLSTGPDQKYVFRLSL